MTLDDLISEQTATVFLNTDHFAKSYTFQSNAAADIPFLGIFDRSTLRNSNTDEANSDLADAQLCVSAATAALFQAAVGDFEKDGWIEIAGQRFSILGETERDSAMVTFALSTTNTKTFRRANPHGGGRPTK